MALDRVADLGCGARPMPGAVGLDYYAFPGKSHVRGDVLRLPFRDRSLRRLYARHVVEHLPTNGHAGGDPWYRFFDEAWRVLMPGGLLYVTAPHAGSPASYSDPTHRRFVTLDTFRPLWDIGVDTGYPRRRWTLEGARLSWVTPDLPPWRLRGPLGRLVAKAVRVPDQLQLILRRFGRYDP